MRFAVKQMRDFEHMSPPKVEMIFATHILARQYVTYTCTLRFESEPYPASTLTHSSDDFIARGLLRSVDTDHSIWENMNCDAAPWAW